ncbi:MAG TPA: glycosyltransferase [Blastocatellia bacterium]|nr:glycosyltransferase [Blastocatellia bacterium]
MLVQIIARCERMNGALQQALMLARAFAGLAIKVRLVNLHPQTHPCVPQALQNDQVEFVESSPDSPPQADLSIVVGLWDTASAEIAARLIRDGSRVVLAPTTYWHRNLLPECANRAEALWYVSWDQAAHSKPYWSLANRVEVVRCAVDLNRFRPSERMPTGRPWVLCRHSCDTPAKFGSDVMPIIKRISDTHNVMFKMLGASQVLGHLENGRVSTLQQEAVDPALFLQTGDIWVYAHASDWRETACIAMLEAMACGLPVVVNNTGGMREYLVHGKTGFACNNTDEFVEFTRLLLDHPTLFVSVAREARNFAQQYHSLDSLKRRLKEFLNQTHI